MGGTPVGVQDVVHMEYIIGLGPISGNEPAIILAHTHSYVEGISLSSISWGYMNTGASHGDVTNTRLTFTLHDIAGKFFELFIQARSPTMYIYFIGPMSTGELMGGNWSVYQPLAEECSIEFSQTQGFTYTLSGMPVVMKARQSVFMPREMITLTGATTEVTKAGTFKDYLNELQIIWNRQTKDKPSAQIKFEYDESKPYFSRHPQQAMTAEKGQSDFIQFKIDNTTPLSAGIEQLWNTIFSNNDEKTGPNKVSLEVSYLKHEGDGNTIGIRFLDKDDATSVIPYPIICVGDDINCSGFPYRGQLSGINFNSLINIIAPVTATETGTDSTAPTGTDANVETTASGNKTDTAGTLPESRTESTELTDAKTFGDEMRKHVGGWGQAIYYLNRYKVPEFIVTIEMPYTSDFSPSAVGGILKDSFGSDTTGIAFHVTQGASLIFFWYTDPTCETLEIQPLISTVYRITKVTHTIGLSGNTTQVELDVLTVTQ